MTYNLERKEYYIRCAYRPSRGREDERRADGQQRVWVLVFWNVRFRQGSGILVCKTFGAHRNLENSD